MGMLFFGFLVKIWLYILMKLRYNWG